MAYNPVPTVATGDLWTASNHNTYIRDNFAAGVPAIFTAPGQVPYASGAGAAAILPAPADGQFLGHSAGLPAWQKPITLCVPSLTNADWDGDAKNTGTYTITASSFHTDIPTAAKFLLVAVSAKFSNTGDANIVSIAPVGHSSENCLVVRATDAYYFMDGTGIVPLVNGQFDIRVAGVSLTSILINVWGFGL